MLGFMPHRRDVGHDRRATEIVQCGGFGFVGEIKHIVFERSQQTGRADLAHHREADRDLELVW